MTKFRDGNKNDKFVKFEGTLSYVLFPRPPKVLGEDGDTFGVTKWKVNKVLDGEFEDPFALEQMIVGVFGDEPIEIGSVHTLYCKQVVHVKYGVQYQVIAMEEKEIDWSSLENQRAFLERIVSPNVVNNLYKEFDNPLKIIANHDKVALVRVKGIGEKKAEELIRKFEAKKGIAQLAIELADYNLTYDFLLKLKDRYGYSSTVVKKITQTPYDLIFEMDGVGFKTADSLALKGGISAKSPERIKGFVYYYLADKAQEGNSYVYASELTQEIFNEFEGKDNILETYYNEMGEPESNNINEGLNLLINAGILVKEEDGDKQKRRIYLKKYYNLEKEISNHLKRLLLSPNGFKYEDWEEKIKEKEKEQGWNFTEEQKEGIKLGLDNQVCFITGGAGCVDADTEFFTGKGWKRIADYQEGDKVLQYNEDGTASLVIPQRYIKEPCKELWHFETNYGVNQTVCDEHKIIYWTQKGKKQVCNIKDIIEKQKNSNSGWRGRFETIFRYNGKGISYSDAEIRLMCAIIADGSFYSNSKEGTNSFLTCRFHIKKERKKQRLKKLFALNNLEYKEKQSQAEGYTDFYITAPVREKEFFSYWYDCNLHQLEVVCDEVLNWDGSINTSHTGTIRRSFSSCSEATIDFIQFAFHNCGYKATKRQYDRRNREHKHSKYNYKSIEYVLTISSRHRIGLNYDNRPNRKTPKTMPQKISTIDGYKYCFTVDSHMLILRRQGNIFITGNCGKSSLVSGILSVLGDYDYAQCSLSGKAAARLKEVTGKDGSTIHRLLKYNPINGFRYNEKNPLPYDIIIVDEVSLIGGEIFLPLLRAMKNGTKLYVLGDMGQLESIGCMNLAADLYYSKTIPTKELTQIHRQAQKSGIITSSHQVREEEQLFDSSFEGELVLGELKDMYFDIVPKEDIVEEVIKYFEQYYYGLAEQEIMNIQLISPVKERGSSCVAVLNKRIQNIVNPQTVIKKPELFISQGGEDKGFILRQGDKVLCTQNLYEIDTTKAGQTTDVFNGWTGIITDIEDNRATIYFPLADEEVVMKEKELKNSIILGYAITCHKMQGASAKIIIGVIDFSTPPKMLTKELLYTMITRAEKIAIIVGQNRAIAKAINTSGISDKKTFLQELLIMKEEDKDLCDKYNNHLIEAMQEANEEIL